MMHGSVNSTKDIFPCLPHYEIISISESISSWKRMIYEEIWTLLWTCSRIVKTCSRPILLKPRVQTRSAGCKASFLILEGSDSTVQSPALPFSLPHQSASSVLAVRRVFGIIKPGAPVLLLFPTVTINLCNGVQSVHDLITYFINWGSITLSQRYNYLCSDAGMFL